MNDNGRQTLPRDLVEPLFTSECATKVKRAHRQRSQNVAAVLLSAVVDPDVLAYYMRVCARVSEVELRQSRFERVGGRRTMPMNHACGLWAEYETLHVRFTDGATDPQRRINECMKEMCYVYHEMIQLLERWHPAARSLSYMRRSSETDQAHVQRVQNCCVALFFRALGQSRQLQAIVARDVHHSRMPCHVAISREGMESLMRNLTFLMQFDSSDLPMNRFLDLLRRLVLFGGTQSVHMQRLLALALQRQLREHHTTE